MAHPVWADFRQRRKPPPAGPCGEWVGAVCGIGEICGFASGLEKLGGVIAHLRQLRHLRFRFIP